MTNTEDTNMKQYNELRTINVNEHLEKKGNLSYLSWAWAVDYLLQQDATAWWEFHEPQSFGDTMMVRCSLHAFGKTIQMHLPVMDNRNAAVKNPDARKVSDAMMRCLTKAIACFGIGLYVYAGEDVPSDNDEPPVEIDIEALLVPIHEAKSMDDLKNAYISSVKTARGNQDVLKLLESAKDSAKATLMTGAAQ